MGCSHHTPNKKEAEFISDDIIFKTKFEKFVYKLKQMKERESDQQYIADIDW